MAYPLNGLTLAETVRAKVKERIDMQGLDLGLAVILVGDDPASHLYVSLKKAACEEAGIRFDLNEYAANESEDVLLEKIRELNERADVTGILVQLPLPSQNADLIIAAIDPNKDVDGFHPDNLARLEAGKNGIAPALELGIMKLIDHAIVHEASPVKGSKVRTAAIVGSKLFARPMAHLLKERGISAAHLFATDPNLAHETSQADVLIVALGKPGFITERFVKEGAIVIDVGTTRKGMKVLGDVDEASVWKKAAAVTPVPGGVGPMTVAMLLLNILKANQLQKQRG